MAIQVIKHTLTGIIVVRRKVCGRLAQTLRMFPYQLRNSSFLLVVIVTVRCEATAISAIDSVLDTNWFGVNIINCKQRYYKIINCTNSYPIGLLSSCVNLRACY